MSNLGFIGYASTEALSELTQPLPPYPLLYKRSLITSIKTARKVRAVSWWNFEKACKPGGNGNFNQKISNRYLIKIAVSSFVY